MSETQVRSTAAAAAGAVAPHCANCGYDLAGLPASAACPECGRSRPERSRSTVEDRKLRAAVNLLCLGLPLSLLVWFSFNSVRVSDSPFVRNIWPFELVTWALIFAGIDLLRRSPFAVMSDIRRRTIGSLMVCLIVLLAIRSATVYWIPDSGILPLSSLRWQFDSALAVVRWSITGLAFWLFGLTRPLAAALERRMIAPPWGLRILRHTAAISLTLGVIWLAYLVVWSWESSIVPRLRMPGPTPMFRLPPWYTQLQQAARIGLWAANGAICTSVWIALLIWRASHDAEWPRERPAPT
jgi:hypothetical protein